eukprot:378065-Heterocapsa_arctica.AAC.1
MQGAATKKDARAKRSNIIKYEHILYIIGDASNPGPSHKGCHCKQRKLDDFCPSASHQERRQRHVVQGE